MGEYRLCRNGLHPMTPENISVTTDGAERCKACRREQARKRRERDADEAADLMAERSVPVLDPRLDFELPLGILGRKWTADGKCRGMDPNWFFSPLIEEEVAEHCVGCPVINLCFAFGVITGEQGIWGGTTERQRSQLTLSHRLTIRQNYGKLYADYLGEKAAPSDRNEMGPAPVPNISPERAAIVQRGIEASDYETAAGLAGSDHTGAGGKWVGVRSE